MRIILFILSIFLLFWCSSEYIDTIQRQHTQIRSSSWDIGPISGELFVLPDERVLYSLVSDIDAAHDRIWLETYTWTEKSTQEAILRAHKRWVDVRVILEWNVYNTPWINNEIVKKLKNADVSFRYADNHRYTFTHIKMWMIDNSVCVSTGNWSYTSFTKNREFIYCTYDDDVINDMEEIFLSDFRYVRPYFPDWLHPAIWLAPENIRTWIYDELKKAKHKIILYNQTVSDDSLISELSRLSSQGIDIEVCQANRDVTWESEAFHSNIQLYSSKKPYLHAKVFLIDDDTVILWSANMTQNAIENNREILISLWHNKRIYDMIFSLYHKDCYSSSINIWK